MSNLNTTPRQVRAEIKRRGLPYEIFKTRSCWYVSGENTSGWHETSLHTFDFTGATPAFWVDAIEDMIKTNAENISD